MLWFAHILRWLKRVGYLLAAVTALLVVAHLAPDEKPLPDTSPIRSLADKGSAEVPLENTWFAFVFGFLAPPEANPFVSGARMVNEALRGASPPLIKAISPPPTDNVCAPCTTEKASTLRRTHQTLLARYTQMRTVTHFHSPLPASHKMLLPEFGPLLSTQSLYLALVQADAADADTMVAMEADLLFWRRALAGTNLVLAKRACLKAIRANLQARAQMSQKWQAAGLLAAASPVPRLTEAELSLLYALRLELAIDYSVMHQLPDFLAENMPRRWDLRLLPYQPVRTFNLHLEQNDAVLSLASLKAADLAAGYGSRPPRLHKITTSDYLFNTTGVWVLDVTDATHLYGNYMLAAHDLDALVVLVNLVEDLARKGRLRSMDRSTFPELSRPYVNPYDKTETASWSETENRLYFNTRPGEASQIRFDLSLELPLK